VISNIARVVLGAVLVIAAAAKLRDRAGVRTRLALLFPDVAVAPIALLLPYLELALAGSLFVFWSSAIPAIVAGLVILAFTVVLIVAEVRHVPCPCFGGGASARPVGALDIVRNGVLLACAVLATGT
jgi:hypothetical protein